MALNTQHPKIPMFGCSETMLGKTQSEHDCICQATTEGSLMEREVLHPAWVYTTPHRTFCVGHSSRHQHKQESEWLRVTMELCWMCIFLLYLWALHTKRYSGRTQCCNSKQQNGRWHWKSSTIGSLLLEEKKKCLFWLFLVKKPKEQTNQNQPNKNPPPPTNNQSTKPHHETWTTKTQHLTVQLQAHSRNPWKALSLKKNGHIQTQF